LRFDTVCICRLKMNIARVQTQPNTKQSQALQQMRTLPFFKSLVKIHSFRTGGRYIMGWTVFRSHCESFTLENLEAVHVLCVNKTYSNSYTCTGDKGQDS